MERKKRKPCEKQKALRRSRAHIKKLEISRPKKSLHGRSPNENRKEKTDSTCLEKGCEDREKKVHAPKRVDQWIPVKKTSECNFSMGKKVGSGYNKQKP